MGKGDKKTKKGKITMGSYGVTRPKRKVKAVITAEATPKAKPAKEKKTETTPKEEKPKKTAKKEA